MVEVEKMEQKTLICISFLRLNQAQLKIGMLPSLNPAEVTANLNLQGHLDVEPSTTMLEQKMATERDQEVLSSLRVEMEAQHSLEQVGQVLIKGKMRMVALQLDLLMRRITKNNRMIM
jgi:hypothetical protein